MVSELERRIADGLVRVVIFFSAKKNSFIVGADLNMLYAITDAKGNSFVSALAHTPLQKRKRFLLMARNY